MHPGREIDIQIAAEVFAHKVSIRDGELFESTPAGERPLSHYSTEIKWAWEVAQKMKITLLPVTEGNWFAFVGPEGNEGWTTPNAMLELLESKKFDTCGAAVGHDVPNIICEAALSAITKRKVRARTADVLPLIPH